MCQFSICFIPPAHDRTNTCKQPTQMLMISIGKCLSIFKQTIRIFGEQRDIIWIQIYACFLFRLFLSLYLPLLLVLSSPFVSRRYAQRKYIFFLDLEYVRTHQEHCCTSDSTIINLVFRRFPSAASLHDRCIVK